MLKPYPAYKSSGMEWLGDVPEHWSVTAAKHISDVRDGTHDTPEYVAEEPNTFPLVTTKDLVGGTVTFGECKRISHHDYIAIAKRSKVVRNDILLPMIGSIGGAVVVATDVQFAIKNVALFRNTGRFCSNWLAYALNGELVNLLFELQRSGGVQAFVSLGTLRDLRIPVPPLPEQIAIANYLDTETAHIDNLIQQQQRLIELLQEKRAAVISNAVTRGLNPDAPMKHSGVEWLGVVPEHWTVISLGRLFRQTSDAGDSTLPILSVSIHYGVSDGQLSEDEQERKVTRSEEKELYKRVKPNDLVYNMMRAWQGGFGTVSVVGQISPAYVVARPTQDLRTQFIEHLLRTPPAIETIRGYSRGVTDFRLRFYWEEFKSLKVAFPPCQHS